MIKSNITVTVPEQNYGAILFNVFKKAAIPAFKVESEILANKIVKDLKLRLRRQLFKHKALNPKYKARKIKFGYDPRILFASGQYYRSITVITTDYGAKVGVKDILHYPNPSAHNWKGKQKYMRSKERKQKGSVPNTMPMVELAKILEYGVASAGGGWKIPPRPHWRPTMSKFMREHNIIKQKFTRVMIEAAQKAIESELANARTREIRL